MIVKIFASIRDFFRKYLFYYRIIYFFKSMHLRNNSDTRSLKKYYENCNLSLPPDSKWRQYRIWLRDGRCIKIKDQLRDEITVRKYLIKYTPISMSYSASAFLNPKDFGSASKKGNTIEKNNFLYNDIFLDIDSADIEMARKNAVFIVEYMKRKGHKLLAIIFSGSKGFHLKYKDKNKYKNPDPRIREKMCLQARKILVKELTDAMKSRNINNYCDFWGTMNMRSFIRLPGTVNCKTGYVCTNITAEELHKPTSEILKNIPKISNVPKAISTDTAEPKIIMKLRLFLDHKQRQSLFSYKAFFVSNRVKGSGFTIFLRYKGRLLPEVIEDISKIQKIFRLGNFYLFRTDTKDEYYAICPEIVKPAKLRDIIKSSKCLHKDWIDFHKELFLRVSRKAFSNSTKSKPIEFLRTLNSKNSNNHVSTAHIKFLEDAGAKNVDYKKNKYYPTGLIVFHDKIIEGKLKEKK